MAKFEVTLTQTVTYYHTIVVECEEEGQIHQVCYDNSEDLDEAVKEFEREGIEVLEQDEGISSTSEFDIEDICEVTE